MYNSPPTVRPALARVLAEIAETAASSPCAGARNSIGIMLVSGMIIGSFFTLFVVPSIYVLVARRRVAAVESGAPDAVLADAAVVAV